VNTINRVRLAGSAAVLALVTGAMPAWAQDQSQQPPAPATAQSGQAVPAQAGPETAQPVNQADRTEDAGSNGNVGEIIVTAQFRQQRLQDTPLAITAVDAATLEARNQTRLTDITAQAPSVQLQPVPAGAGTGMSAYIRGLGQADQSPSVEPGVGIYVDDVYFATITASIFDLVDLDRVEVLRGPQGTLAGMNSEGGAIKLYSRKPTGEGGYVEASLGSYNRRDFRASADFALIPETLFARVSGLYRQRDGFVKRLDYACTHPNDPDVVAGRLKSMANGTNCKLGEMGDQDVKAIRGSLRWLGGDKLEVNVIGDYTKDKSQTQASTLLRAANNPNVTVPYQGVAYDNRFVPYGVNRGDTVYNDPYITYANFYDPGVTFAPATTQGPGGAAAARNGAFIVPSASQVDGWGLSGTVDYQISDNLTFKSITGYRKYDSLSGDDNDGSPIVFIMQQQQFFHKQFSEEGRLSGKFLDNTLNFTVGAIYFHQRTRYYNKNDSPFAGFGTAAQPTFAFINDDVVVNKQIAGFANASWDATDQLVLEGGVRFTHQKKEYTFGRFAFDGSGAPFLPLSDPANPLNGRVGLFKGNNVDYRAVASYKFTPAVMGYAQFATGFKGGGITPRPYFPEQVLGFGPERVRSYELGVKSDLFDRLLRVNADVYYMDFLGYQGTPDVCVDASGNPLQGPPGTRGLCGQYLNLGDAKVKGFELEATLRPFEGMTIEGSTSYNDFKFKTPNINTQDFRKGDTRPGIGKFKWSVGAQYLADLGDFGTLSPRIDFVHTPGFCGSLARLCVSDPIRRVDSYDIVNARLTYRSPDRDWSLALEATNLFDKTYYINKVVTQYASGQPGRPREIALTLRRNF
jgi:iron complex outermembrane receptor protein